MVGVMINERLTLLLQWRACDEVFIYRFGAGSGRRTALSPFCDRLLKDQLKRLTPEARLPRRRSTCSGWSIVALVLSPARVSACRAGPRRLRRGSPSQAIRPC